MVHVKLTKKIQKMVDGKEVTVERTCSAEQSQVPLMEKSGWTVVGKKPTEESEETGETSKQDDSKQDTTKQTTTKQTGPKANS